MLNKDASIACEVSSSTPSPSWSDDNTDIGGQIDCLSWTLDHGVQTGAVRCNSGYLVVKNKSPRRRIIHNPQLLRQFFSSSALSIRSKSSTAGRSLDGPVIRSIPPPRLSGYRTRSRSTPGYHRQVRFMSFGITETMYPSVVLAPEYKPTSPKRTIQQSGREPAMHPLRKVSNTTTLSKTEAHKLEMRI